MTSDSPMLASLESDGSSTHTRSPFDWTVDPERARVLNEKLQRGDSPTRMTARSASMPLIMRCGSISRGMKQALRNVTAFHSSEEIGGALAECGASTRDRLKTLNDGLSEERELSNQRSASIRSIQRVSSISPDMRHQSPVMSPQPQSYPSPESNPSQPPTDNPTIEQLQEEISMLHMELQDREQQILQAVELGTGLLRELESERADGSDREKSLQMQLDDMTKEMRESNIQLTKYKTACMYYLNVEEELVGMTVENLHLRDENAELGRQAQECSNVAWLEGKLMINGHELQSREKIQEELERDVEVKLKELNGWKTRAARSDRLAHDLETAQEALQESEKESRRLKKLLKDRERVIYGLKEQLTNRDVLWKLESTESTVVRLKRDILRLRQSLDQQKEITRESQEETRRAQHRANEKRSVVVQPDMSHFKLSSDTFIKEIVQAKEDCFDEMCLWLQAVRDVARDNRCQGDVLRRLRNENSSYRERIRYYEEAEMEAAKSATRSRLVNSCQEIHKSLLHLKDYARAVKGQSAVRQITEKELSQLASGLGSICRLFLSFMQSALTLSEKKIVGIALTDCSYQSSPVSFDSSSVGHDSTPTKVVRKKTGTLQPSPTLPIKFSGSTRYGYRSKHG
eukprot:TRINITY_DN20976_c0_g1_i1.p1 TRINITY_DN20976_c0_g1~~TRINITY_DN20976_c0_g1_i1.p1  ORF type:complete len:632 (+),score=150.29 TRINITY_DN20976_c0_g1_i1:102-1997(+)